MTAKRPSPYSAPQPWNDVATGYAEETGLLMGPFSERAAELADVREGMSVVDVAAGPGTLTLQLARRGVRVCALDFSESMLDELRKRVPAERLTHVEVSLGDGQALPYGSDRFDAGFSMFGLMFFPSRSRGFSELFRVVKPQAKVVVSSWAPVAQSSLMQVMFGALRAMDPSVPESKYDPASLENPDVFAEELGSAGFEEIKIIPHEVEFEVESAEKLWNVLVRSSAPLAVMRRAYSDAEWEQKSALAKEFISAEVTRSGPRLKTTAYLGVARKLG